MSRIGALSLAVVAHPEDGLDARFLLVLPAHMKLMSHTRGFRVGLFLLRGSHTSMSRRFRWVEGRFASMPSPAKTPECRDGSSSLVGNDILTGQGACWRACSSGAMPRVPNDSREEAGCVPSTGIS